MSRQALFNDIELARGRPYAERADEQAGWHDRLATTLYAGFAQIWKSTNQGTSWTQLGTITGTTNFKSLAVAPSNSSVI